MSDSLDYREAADYVAESGDTATAANALRAAADQIAQLTEALAFYADPASYKNATPRTVRPVIEDQGSRARAFLADKEDAE